MGSSIMSVKEARKILGADYRAKSDEEILELIAECHKWAVFMLDMYKEKRL